ncbi:putative minus-end-directed kinesin ATPase [Helianthus annuus]|nr:putative minus-end-directed kinesin ATPase [Helianthus annuus]KAJ0684913.1 putative minus-end-directed kinesin ATPase [Helianthus annuus]KAJ0870059.1 putative minus-end-directed kinesin ATPase [Helianthus annuus]
MVASDLFKSFGDMLLESSTPNDVVDQIETGEMREYGLVSLVQTSAELLKDRFPEVREAARGMVLLVSKAVMGDGENEEEDKWQNFCQLNLPAIDALTMVYAGGNTKTLMFAHVGPEGDSFGETVCTLKFAQGASTIELGAARLNKESREVMDLKEQIERLKKQLAEKDPQSAQQVNKLEPGSPLPRAKAAALMIDRTPKSP